MRQGWNIGLEEDGIKCGDSWTSVKIDIKYKMRYQPSERSTYKEKFKIFQKWGLDFFDRLVESLGEMGKS